MLGIGMQEMMIIGLAALLIFGPGKLPEVMGQAGKYYKQFRDMTGELTGEFEKTVAEAKEMGNQLTGDLGPMQKELESVTNSAKRDLNKSGRSTRSSSNKAKGSQSSTKSANKSRTSSTSRTSSSKSTSSKNATTSRTSSSKSTGSKKPATPPVATKEDPDSDFSMFAQEAPTRTRRARRATPSVISDPTPRLLDAERGDESAPAPDVAPVDSAVARARQRRQHAGYAQRSA